MTDIKEKLLTITEEELSKEVQKIEEALKDEYIRGKWNILERLDKATC